MRQIALFNNWQPSLLYCLSLLFIVDVKPTEIYANGKRWCWQSNPDLKSESVKTEALSLFRKPSPRFVAAAFHLSFISPPPPNPPGFRPTSQCPSSVTAVGLTSFNSTDDPLRPQGQSGNRARTRTTVTTRGAGQRCLCQFEGWDTDCNKSSWLQRWPEKGNRDTQTATNLSSSISVDFHHQRLNLPCVILFCKQLIPPFWLRSKAVLDQSIVFGVHQVPTHCTVPTLFPSK